ncbi:MAG: hypothetical protein RLZZ591_2713 [Pseudomonadota bacterium]|jgi:hypothetical protein
MKHRSQGLVGRIGRWWALPVVIATLAACGGGSGSSANADRVATFIDAHVAGLEFKSASRSGLTDANGNFPYQVGETITFSIGNLVLGTITPTGDKVTPLDLVPNAMDSSDPRVIRMLQALQTLDSDANPSNGIQISPSARDFARKLVELRLDRDTLTDAEIEDHLETKKFLVTAKDAKSHFDSHRNDPSKSHKGYSGKTSKSTSGTNVTATQPANTEGRLLASNCFQCHGTMGRGGFESIRGSEAKEVLDYLKQTDVSTDIMAAHAQGYTTEQLTAIINYLQQ